MVTKKKDRTSEVLIEMLKECTGKSFLDSGDAYGRHWEENQEIDFKKELPVKLVIDECGIDYGVNVYHWLMSKVTYDSRIDKIFQRFMDNDKEDRCYLELMEAFPEYLKKNEELKIGGLYGKGDAFTENTYNRECNLSQTLQFVFMSIDNEQYIILQIHNGCDVRGGYTKPRVFATDESILMVADGQICCSGDQGWNPNQLNLLTGKPEIQAFHYWQTDDNSNWYYDGSTEYSKLRLNKLELKEIKSIKQWEKGKLCYDKDGNGYCPLCGGKLIAGF